MTKKQAPASFITTQAKFSHWMRDPENHPAFDDIEPRRMAIYASLVYNNIESFLANGFPVIRAISTDLQWAAMVRDFIITHRSESPLFHEISQEFVAYLSNERDNSTDPAFLLELAHYEWVELALSVSTDEIPATAPEPLDLLAVKYQLSPLAWLLQYQFPVHEISPNFQPEHAADIPISLLVYRAADDGVTFIECNSVSARLLDLLQQNISAQIAAEQIVTELQHPNPDIVLDGARKLIQDWLSRQVLSIK